jgi:hypothetical protein
LFFNKIIIFVFLQKKKTGKRHQTNLARRAAREAKEGAAMPSVMRPSQLSQQRKMVQPKRHIKIGRPGLFVVLFFVNGFNFHFAFCPSQVIE